MCDSWKLKMRLRKCEDQSVEVYLMYKGEQLSICGNCWSKICEKGKIEPDKEDTCPKPLFGDKE